VRLRGRLRVVDYVNIQSPMILMYSLNHVVREHKKTMDRMDESVMQVNVPTVDVPTVDAADSAEYVDV